MSRLTDELDDTVRRIRSLNSLKVRLQKCSKAAMKLELALLPGAIRVHEPVLDNEILREKKRLLELQARYEAGFE